jgi:hypothetical protein
MKSKNGALLTKISAVINFIIAGLVFLGSIIAVLGLSFYRGLPINLGVLGFLAALVILVFGLLVWNAGSKMEDSRTVRNGAVWAVVLGAITIGTVSGILALIGGILGLMDADKKK